MSWEKERKKCDHCSMERDVIKIRCDLCGISNHVENRPPLVFAGSKVPDGWQYLILPEARDESFHLCPKCRLGKREEADEAKRTG